MSTAQIIMHPTARGERIVQLRRCGRLPKSVASLRRKASDLRHVEYLEAEVQKHRLAIAAIEDALESAYLVLAVAIQSLEEFNG